MDSNREEDIMGWFADKYGEEARPVMPIEVFEDLFYKLDQDEEAIKRVVSDVQDGRRTVEEVQRTLNRPDIEPEQWRDFEDGWRPDGW